MNCEQQMQFLNYANNVLYQTGQTVHTDLPEAVMLNGYTTFLLSNKVANISEKRMNWIIDNYCNYEHIDKVPFQKCYIENIKNTKCTNVVPVMPVMHTVPDNEQKWEDDVGIHYRELANRNAALVEYNKRLLMKSDASLDDDINFAEYVEESETDMDDYQSTIDDEEGYDMYDEYDAGEIDDYYDRFFEYEDDYDY